jgi:ketosteroid isomerase-like protein
MTNLPLTLDGLDQMPPADQKAIGETLGILLTSFARREAEPLRRVYTADTDWVNAFGSVKHGVGEIVPYLEGLFADRNFNDGKMAAPPRSHLHRLSDDIVTVSSHLQIEGQGLVGGGAIPVRNNHSLRVLQRQDDGHWQIVSEMYNDANTEQSYAGHS